MMTKADPLSRLRQVAGRLETGDAALEAYRQAAEVLTTALPHLREISAGEDAAQAGLYRSLITQPAPGMHQLAHQVSHLATAGTPDMAEQLMHPLGPTLAGLIDRLEDLSPRAQARTVLFAVATRAFSRDVVPPQTVSRLHSSHFSSFDPADLGLPYSVMFSPRVFGRNKDDLIETFLPRGHLERLDGLRPDHVLLLAWLSGADIFGGPVGLAEVAAQTDMADPLQAAALRSLAMRFGDSAFRAGVGLPATAVMPDCTSPSTTLERLQRKPYQALNTALNKARTALPFLAPLHRKPRVGLCLSGQLRGYETALESWRKHLFPLIEAQIFLHSWRDVGRSGAQPSRAVLPFAGAAFTRAYKDIAVASGFEAMKAAYPTLFGQLSEGARVSEDQLRATYGTAHVVLEDDTDEAFTGFSNQQKMHYKIHAADALARQAGEVDLLMRLRPDLGLRGIGFSWRDLLEAARSGPLLFAEKGYGVHYGSLMIGDQCAIATPQTMKSMPGPGPGFRSSCPWAWRSCRHSSPGTSAWRRPAG